MDTADIPVLLMSGFGRPAAHEGDGFLGKPFHIDELLAFIGPYVEAHTKRRISDKHPNEATDDGPSARRLTSR